MDTGIVQYRRLLPLELHLGPPHREFNTNFVQPADTMKLPHIAARSRPPFPANAHLLRLNTKINLTFDTIAFAFGLLDLRNRPLVVFVHPVAGRVWFVCSTSKRKETMFQK